MLRNFQTVAVALAILGVVAIPLAAQNRRRYKLVDLGTLGGPGSRFTEFQRVLNGQGLSASGADLSVPNPFPGCFDPFITPDCYVQHAYQSNGWGFDDLGTLPGGSDSFPYAINDGGLIVGGSEDGVIDPGLGTPEFHATLWKNRAISDLGTLGGTSSLSTWVNRRGQVVGFAQNPIPDPYSLAGLGTQTRAFLWQDGKLRDLMTLGGGDSFAQYVNDLRQVAGVSYTSFDPDPGTGLPPLHPFLWQNGHMKDLGDFGGANGLLGPFVFGLNNRGEVVGGMNAAGDQTTRAFLWNGEKLLDLGTLGGSFAGATGLNDAGEVTGFAALAGDQVSHGFLWRPGEMRDLPPVEGDPCSLPIWINSTGQVVGNSSDCSVDLHATLWEDGRAIDLNAFVPAGSGIQLCNAVFINDRGEIAGALAPPGVSPQQADQLGHAFLLIPCGADEAGCQAEGSLSSPATVLGSGISHSTGTELMTKIRMRLARRYRR